MESRAAVSPSRRSLAASGVLISLISLFLACASLAQARGNAPLQLGVYDNPSFVDPSVSAGERNFWLDRADDAGTGVIRLDLVWRKVLVDQSVAPATASNPADPNYDFSDYDDAVRAAASKGMSVLLTIWSAPEFAEGPARPPVDCLSGQSPPDCAPEGSWKPDPTAFADFGAAVATRYSGSFTPLGSSSPLPKVKYLQAWNEPNLSVFLNPQRNPDGSAFSPGHYRSMLNAFYDAVHAKSSGALVLGPGASPLGPGQSADLLDQRTSPQDFIRQLACVRSSGGSLKITCSAKPKFDIFAHNAIPSGQREITDLPYYPNADLQPANFEKGTALVRGIESLRKVLPAVGGGRPIWATEFWTESDPPTEGKKDLRGQADSIQQGMRMLWEKGADFFLYFKLRDQIPYDAVINPDGCLKQCGAGLFPNTATWPFTVADEPPKPAFTAFTFPFTVERTSKTKASAWFRPPLKGTAAIESFTKGKWTRIAKIGVRKGVPVTADLSLTGKARLRARMGSRSSLVWSLR